MGLLLLAKKEEEERAKIDYRLATEIPRTRTYVGRRGRSEMGWKGKTISGLLRSFSLTLDTRREGSREKNHPGVKFANVRGKKRENAIQANSN